MTQESLARRLRVLRAERALTLAEAEELTGVTRETLGALEHGRRGAYTSTLQKIAKGYGTTISALLEEDEEPVPLSETPRPPVTGYAAVIQRLRDEAGHDHIAGGVDGNLLDAEDMSVVEIKARMLDLAEEVQYLRRFNGQRRRLFEDADMARAVIRRLRRPFLHILAELAEVAKYKARAAAPSDEAADEAEAEIEETVSEVLAAGR